MNDSIDTFEERILLGELGNYLSVVGQVGSYELGSDVSLGGDRRDHIDCDIQPSDLA
jgi:hypothetical protein